MTQISRKLFNKSPFARNDIRSLSRAGRAGRRRHVARLLVKGVCMCVFQMTFESPPDRSGAAFASIGCRSFLHFSIDL